LNARNTLGWQCFPACLRLLLRSPACFFGPVSARFLKNWIPLLLWMAVIFIASTSAGSPDVSSHFLRPLLKWLFPGITEHTFDVLHLCARKAAHLTEYGVLGCLALRTAREEPALAAAGLAGQVAAALIFAAFYASTDEFHQRFVPTRHSSPVDVMIDTVGAAIGVGLMVMAERARRRLRPRSVSQAGP